MYQTFATIIIPAVVVFITTFYSTRFLISYLFGAGIIAEDINKAKPVKLASSGGIGVAFGIVFGILLYIFGTTFIFKPVLDIDALMAVALSISLITFVGFIDDINVKGEKVKSTDIMDIRQGLKQWQKPILTLVGALPLMAINAGTSTIILPFIGTVGFGLLYPLLIIPLAVVFIPNAVNILGGFDGLQPAMILVASGGLMIYSIVFGTGASAYMGAFLAAMLFSAVLAFFPYNKYKARVIPGDSFTYAAGAGLAAIMIMGNAEAFGLIIFIPWIIEFFLHLRRKFKVRDLGIRQSDGTMKAPYGKKIYSLCHLVMNLKKKPVETDVTLWLTVLEVLFVVLAFGLKIFGFL
jgi:UDP-N-acetylglucosamine--dolichyl-phosphate N-acetylglucosaminephosphotransferase